MCRRTDNTTLIDSLRGQWSASECRQYQQGTGRELAVEMSLCMQQVPDSSFDSIKQFRHDETSPFLVSLYIAKCQKVFSVRKLTEIENKLPMREQVIATRVESKTEGNSKKATLIAVWYKWRHLWSEAVNKNNHTRNWAKSERHTLKRGKTPEIRQTTNDNYAYDKLFFTI